MVGFELLEDRKDEHIEKDEVRNDDEGDEVKIGPF